MRRIGTILSAGACAAIVMSGPAQQPVQKPSFEVASLKRNADKLLTMSGLMPSPGGRVSVKASTLKGMLQSAYRVKGREIVGGPDWIDTERYDIEAKAAEDVPWEPQLRLMFQSLLAERFQLKLHQETRQMPIYELSTAKNGLKLTKSTVGDCAKANGPCGGFATKVGRIWGQRGTLSQLSESLSAITDRPVVDRTGQSDYYDVMLEWVPDESQFQEFGAGAYKNVASDPSGPSLVTALQELGLRLVPSKGSVDVIVIDSVQKATTN